MASVEILPILEQHAGNVLFRRAFSSVQTPEALLGIMANYVEFSRVFGACVASLAGNIAARADLFRYAEELLVMAQDCSYVIASKVFYAAIDEFAGKTHRALAQATLKDMGACFGYNSQALNNFLRTIPTTRDAVRGILHGYGLGRIMTDDDILYALGFHWASEWLAGGLSEPIAIDGEFRIIDDAIRNMFPGLAESLEQVDGYTWIKEHASLEIEHRDAARDAVYLALRYYVGENARQIIFEGFKGFCNLQEKFMYALSAKQF